MMRPFRMIITAGMLAAVARYAAAADGPSAAVDRAVAEQLARAGVAPAARCTDAVFIRRAYLDVTGTLPTAAEVRSFLDDRAPDKREALVDRLLGSEAYADYGSMRWCDLLRVKSEFPVNLWPNAVQAYHRWIRTAVRDNLPYDRFARELLTASGSNFRVPQVNFYRAVPSKTPEALAQAAALAFLGERAERWQKERLHGVAGFFAQVGYKETAEWKEEIVYFNAAATNARPSAVLPDGVRVTFAPEEDPRAVFADWLTGPGSLRFARCAANRAWAWLLGRGIVEEPDDFRPDNPPSNPALLDLLARELAAGRYDLRRLYAIILKSETYQRGSVPRAASLAESERHFACYPVRRLEAEVLIDAINQITGSGEAYTSQIPEPFSHIPPEVRAVALADGSVTSPFLSLFGRSPRETGLLAERATEATAAQRLHLLNASHVQRKLEEGVRLHEALRRAGDGPREAAETLFLTILSRPPTADELAAVAAYREAAGGGRRAATDVAWALINTAEFQYRH